MFEDRNIRRKRRYFLAAVFLLLASAAFGIGYYFNVEPPKDEVDPGNPAKANLQIPDSLINPTPNEEPPEQVNGDNSMSQEVNMPNKDFLTPNTQLIFKTYYNYCKHTIDKSVQAVNDEINLNEQQLKEKYTGWEVSAFSPPIVELSRTIDTYCPNHFIIGADKGYIAIYVYDENGNKLLQEKTDISIATLPPEDQQALTAGIVVDTEDQKEQTLEGFSD